MTETSSLNETFFRLPSRQRYDEVIALIKKKNSIWTLSDAQGCLILPLGQDKILPIWPTPELALSWGQKDYPDFTPLEISSMDWTDKWLLGMEKDGFDVGVAPNLAGECIVSSAQEHAGDIQG